MRVFEGIFKGLKTEKPQAAIFQVDGLEGVVQVEAIPFYEIELPEEVNHSKNHAQREAQLRARIKRLRDNLIVNIDLSNCQKVAGSVRGEAVLESISGTNLRAKFLALNSDCAEFCYREKRMIVKFSHHPWLTTLLPQKKIGSLMCVEVVDLVPLDQRHCGATLIDIKDA